MPDPWEGEDKMELCVVSPEESVALAELSSLRTWLSPELRDVISHLGISKDSFYLLLGVYNQPPLAELRVPMINLSLIPEEFFLQVFEEAIGRTRTLCVLYAATTRCLCKDEWLSPQLLNDTLCSMISTDMDSEVSLHLDVLDELLNAWMASRDAKAAGDAVDRGDQIKEVRSCMDAIKSDSSEDLNEFGLSCCLKETADFIEHDLATPAMIDKALRELEKQDQVRFLMGEVAGDYKLLSGDHLDLVIQFELAHKTNIDIRCHQFSLQAVSHVARQMTPDVLALQLRDLIPKAADIGMKYPAGLQFSLDELISLKDIPIEEAKWFLLAHLVLRPTNVVVEELMKAILSGNCKETAARWREILSALPEPVKKLLLGRGEVKREEAKALDSIEDILQDGSFIRSFLLSLLVNCRNNNSLALRVLSTFSRDDTVSGGDILGHLMILLEQKVARRTVADGIATILKAASEGWEVAPLIDFQKQPDVFCDVIRGVFKQFEEPKQGEKQPAPRFSFIGNTLKAMNMLVAEGNEQEEEAPKDKEEECSPAEPDTPKEKGRRGWKQRKEEAEERRRKQQKEMEEREATQRRLTQKELKLRPTNELGVQLRDSLKEVPWQTQAHLLWRLLPRLAGVVHVQFPWISEPSKTPEAISCLVCSVFLWPLDDDFCEGAHVLFRILTSNKIPLKQLEKRWSVAVGGVAGLAEKYVGGLITGSNAVRIADLLSTVYKLVRKALDHRKYKQKKGPLSDENINKRLNLKSTPNEVEEWLRSIATKDEAEGVIDKDKFNRLIEIPEFAFASSGSLHAKDSQAESETPAVDRKEKSIGIVEKITEEPHKEGDSEFGFVYADSSEDFKESGDKEDGEGVTQKDEEKSPVSTDSTEQPKCDYASTLSHLLGECGLEAKEKKDTVGESGEDTVEKVTEEKGKDKDAGKEPKKEEEIGFSFFYEESGEIKDLNKESGLSFFYEESGEIKDPNEEKDEKGDGEIKDLNVEKDEKGDGGTESTSNEIKDLNVEKDEKGDGGTESTSNEIKDLNVEKDEKGDGGTESTSNEIKDLNVEKDEKGDGGTESTSNEIKDLNVEKDEKGDGGTESTSNEIKDLNVEKDEKGDGGTESTSNGSAGLMQNRGELGEQNRRGRGGHHRYRNVMRQQQQTVQAPSPGTIPTGQDGNVAGQSYVVRPPGKNMQRKLAKRSRQAPKGNQ